MPKAIINNIPDTVPTLSIFSQAVISKGLVYLSGNVGCDQDFNIVIGGIRAQGKAALENIQKVLEGAGSGLNHIIKVTVYMTNLTRDFQEFNEVYAEFFNPGEMPARTCIGVASLPLGALVEIECVAELAEEDSIN